MAVINNMKKSSLPKPITILVLTLLTAIVWVGLSIYRAATITPPQSVPENISKTLNPTLNSSALDQIDSGIFFGDQDVPEVGSLEISLPEAAPTLVEETFLDTTEATESTDTQTE